MKTFSTVLLALLAITALSACRQKDNNAVATPSEDLQAKALLQGVWIESETEEVSFIVKGDSVYFPDATSQPTSFRIVSDSFLLGESSYPIEKQSAHVFWFRNQNGDMVKLQKSGDSNSDLTVQQQATAQAIMLNEKVKTDSVVMFAGNRYHWYTTINPTRYKVQKTVYNNEGMAVENVYYDNIINITIFQGGQRLFSRDFRKQMYAKNVPADFLDQAVLGNMQFDRVDTQGFHFNATLCIPDGASCYLIETLIDFSGHIDYKLLEY